MLGDPESVATAALAEIEMRAAEAMGRSGRFSLVLSGGSTPLRLFRLMATEPARLDWPRIHLFWGDERNVPAEHPESNFGAARAALIEPLALPEANVHRIPATGADPEAAAASYEAELRRFFGLSAGQLPRFDLVLLGMGSDGHTASLFPGTRALQESERLTVANPVPQLDTTRITLTLPVLNAAAAVLFLVVGAGKAPALDRIRAGGVGAPPAARVLPEGELIWLVDRDANGGQGE